MTSRVRVPLTRFPRVKGRTRRPLWVISAIGSPKSPLSAKSSPSSFASCIGNEERNKLASDKIWTSREQTQKLSN